MDPYVSTVLECPALCGTSAHTAAAAVRGGRAAGWLRVVTVATFRATLVGIHWWFTAMAPPQGWPMWLSPQGWPMWLSPQGVPMWVGPGLFLRITGPRVRSRDQTLGWVRASLFCAEVIK